MTTLTVGGCWTRGRLLTTSAKRFLPAESRASSGVIAVDAILSHASALKLVNGVRGAPGSSHTSHTATRPLAGCAPPWCLCGGT
jgi:hypothetical protein